jgi:hypothetical protein
MNERPVYKIPEEKFITTSDSSSEITECDGRGVIIRIWEGGRASDHDPNHVQNERKSEILHIIQRQPTDWRQSRRLPFGMGCTRPGI